MKNLYLVVEGAAFLTNAAFFSFLISLPGKCQTKANKQTANAYAP